MKNHIRILVCCFMIGFSSCTNDFQIFKIKYNKTYHNEAEVTKLYLLEFANYTFYLSIKIVHTFLIF